MSTAILATAYSRNTEEIDLSILIDETTRLVVYGIAGAYGSSQVRAMQAMGTNIVAGVSVGAGGQMTEDVQVFDTMADAVAETDANTAIIYVPAAGTLDSVVACVDAGVKTIMAAAEFTPLHDTMRAAAHARENGAWLIGPNTVGISSPGKSTLGAFPSSFVTPGSIGLITRSGTLGITVARQLSQFGLGQSTCAHVGGDSISGRNPSEYFQQFEKDPETSLIAYCGEIGGAKEYDIIENLGTISKPVVAMIVGHASPREKRLGHAGALISSDKDTAQAKSAALSEAGVHVAYSIPEFVGHIRNLETSE